MTTIHCAFCGATRRDVTLWTQIVDLRRPVICCDGTTR